ncbi:putative DNase [Selenomonas ruminantium subsp. lactilytica TAM6421]|uniref:Putative DNase n=1 Tax=Selenomonas ruminantium subsp. lactilytica (strain NBRC 103574 / TAM6421) TaxID=927704 RepID=I0GMB3_SELRL|nr:TatD family hydrolase [Selenomonas ruminantium]BAL81900.1 putative DNase [Selenomonas ruminantium subsp. lactilytica TAM6421]
MAQFELVDTHTHLNDGKFAGSEAEVIQRAREAGVTRLINMGDTMKSSAKAVELAAQYEGVYAGVGIHPEEIYEITSAEDDQLAAWTQEKRVVAIGEIGLDYYWEKDEAKRELQRRMFIHQLDLARQLHLPVCIHDREAHGDTLAILKKEGKGLRGVLHCFSGSWEMAQEIYKMGWFIGVDGPLTYKNAAKLPEIVEKFPLERILVETDAPYLAPVPMRGKQNEPAFVTYVAEKVAEIRGISMEMVAKQTSINAEELYGI